MGARAGATLSCPRANAAAPVKPEPADDAGDPQLAALGSGIRTSLAWAEHQAREHDMTPARVQLGLAIRARPHQVGPRMTERAVRHFSVLGGLFLGVRLGQLRGGGFGAEAAAGQDGGDLELGRCLFHCLLAGGVDRDVVDEAAAGRDLQQW